MAFDIYGIRHPLMRTTDTIDIIGANGDRCRIAGIGARDDWGPMLAPASTGLWDAPFRTNWTPSAFGQRFASWSWERRDAVFTVHIVNPVTGLPYLDNDSDQWHGVYSRWKALWSMEKESTVVYTSLDGERRLGARLLQTPKPFATQQFEGKDPHLFPYGSIAMPVACELPFYVGETQKFAWETDGTGDFWFRMPFWNPATVACWPTWYLTDQARWILPDPSWGWEEYGRGLEDEGKTVPVPRVGNLLEGENIDVVTRPDEETIRAENDAPVYARQGGVDFEYPIQPGCGEAPEFDFDGNCVNGATVRVLNVTNPAGARCEIELPRWWSEPFGTPLVA